MTVRGDEVQVRRRIDFHILYIYNVCIMSTTLISFKTDDTTKAELQAFAKALGISTSALLNMNVRQMLRDRSITAEAPLEPTPYLEKIMREADEDIRTGKNITSFDNVDDALKYLDTLR